jgi:NAD(P)H-hydrate epimerase
MKLATSSQMKALDATAIHDYGIPGIVLMENAGKGTVDYMEHHFGSFEHRSVPVFIGPGNNGGDGLVIARHVLQRGGVPLLIYLVAPDTLKGDAGINQSICRQLRIPHILVTDDRDVIELEKEIQIIRFTHPVHSFVDALFGTGLSRNIEGRFAAIIHLMNTLSQTHSWPIVSVDIPSGLCADTGEPLGCCVQAELSVTYGLAKPGHFLHGGSSVGKLEIVDIGLPGQMIDKVTLPGQLLNKSVACRLRQRDTKSHKGSFGHLLILAGSEGKTGAAILSGKAALHSGCGLVTLAVPRKLNAIFETALPEAMTVPLPGSAIFLSSDDYPLIQELLQGKSGLVIGPGLGTHPETAELVSRIYLETEIPVVVDADALNLLAEHPQTMLNPGGSRILTPHPGEMARLAQTSTASIQQDRIKAAGWLNDKNITTSHEIITVLKGAGTVVFSSQGNWAINSSGNNGMATGGMGDVLAGLVGGLLVQGYNLQDAANLGVYLHGLAADILAEQTPHGYLASEVAATIPRAISKLAT